MFLDVPYGSVLPPSLMVFFYPNFTFRVPKSHKKPWPDGVGSQIWMAPLISNLCSLLPSTTNFYHYWKVIVSVLIVLSTISTSVNTISTGVSIINANVRIIIKSIGIIIVAASVLSLPFGLIQAECSRGGRTSQLCPFPPSLPALIKFLTCKCLTTRLLHSVIEPGEVNSWKQLFEIWGFKFSFQIKEIFISRSRKYSFPGQGNIHLQVKKILLSRSREYSFPDQGNISFQIKDI